MQLRSTTKDLVESLSTVLAKGPLVWVGDWLMNITVTCCSHAQAGSVKIEGSEYWLEPASGISGVITGNHPHVLFRRASPMVDTRYRKKRKKKKKKRHEKNCGTRGRLGISKCGKVISFVLFNFFKVQFMMLETAKETKEK